jgi:hypothetical protein
LRVYGPRSPYASVTTSETAAAMNMSDCLRWQYRGGGFGVSKGARQERRRGVIAPRPVTEKSGRRRVAFQRRAF